MESADYGDSYTVEGDSIESQSPEVSTDTPGGTPGPFRRFTLPRFEIIIYLMFDFKRFVDRFRFDKILLCYNKYINDLL